MRVNAEAANLMADQQSQWRRLREELAGEGLSVVSSEDVTGAEKRLDATTKKHTDQIDEMLKAKEAELLEV